MNLFVLTAHSRYIQRNKMLPALQPAHISILRVKYRHQASIPVAPDCFFLAGSLILTMLSDQVPIRIKPKLSQIQRAAFPFRNGNANIHLISLGRLTNLLNALSGNFHRIIIKLNKILHPIIRPVHPDPIGVSRNPRFRKINKFCPVFTCLVNKITCLPYRCLQIQQNRRCLYRCCLKLRILFHFLSSLSCTVAFL